MVSCGSGWGYVGANWTCCGCVFAKAAWKFGGADDGGGYDDEVAAEIEGEVAECRTKLTSRVPSPDHRSTVKT